MRLVSDKDNISMYLGFCRWRFIWIDVSIRRFISIIVRDNKMKNIMLMIILGLRLSEELLFIVDEFLVFVMLELEVFEIMVY